MIEASLTYLQRSDDWMKTVLVGGLLTLFGFLLLPLFVVMGYLMRVLRRTMRGDEQPPEFGEWGEMFVDGLKASVVAFVYGLIPFVLGVVVFAMGVAGALFGNSGAAGAFGGLVALVGMLVAFLLSLAAAYVIPAALANYAEHDSIGAGFAIGDIRPVLTDSTYATAWVLGFAIVVAASVVTGVLNFIPFLGAFVGSFLSFYAFVAAYYLVGTAWSELRRPPRTDGETSTERPTV